MSWKEISMNNPSLLGGEELGGAAVRRRLVGTALRRYREHIGYGLDDAANVLECHRSKISRIETGQRGIRPKELRELLTEYGIGESEQTALTAITHPRNGWHGWWHDYADIIPSGYPDLLSMETLASEILVYDAQQIPDLLQTRGYFRAAAESDPQTPEPGMLDRLAEMSFIRQQVIVHERCTTVTAVIGEAALRQQVGNAEVMRDQIRWLAEVSSTCPSVTLQVLPFGSSIHPQSTAPMSILRFAEAPSLGVVHLRGLNGGVCLIDQAAITSHVRAFTQLQLAALPPHQSAHLMREIPEAVWARGLTALS
jgi:transcriptional regulator with XRE-family HTH domain